VEGKVPYHLKADPAKGIKKDCPLQLKAKENKRKVLLMMIQLYTGKGMADELITEKINTYNFDN
jgi:hypothetical protein